MLAGWQRAVSHGAVTRAGDLRGRSWGGRRQGAAPAGQAGMLQLGSAGPVSSSVQVPQIIPSSRLSKDGGIHIPRIFTVPIL